MILGLHDGSDSQDSSWNTGDPSLIPGSGRSPGEGNDYPLQYSCLGNPHGQRGLVGHSPWGCKQSDMTKRLTLRSLFITILLYLKDINNFLILISRFKFLIILWYHNQTTIFNSTFSKEAQVSYICHFVLILQFPGIFLAEECSEVTQGGLGEELGAREEKERL